jgi:hypothetical protein
MTESSTNTPASSNGTTSEKPLNSVSEKLGHLDQGKLTSLLRKTLMNEPSEQASTAPAEAAKAEEKPVEQTSEETESNDTATEEKNDLSQEQVKEPTSDDDNSTEKSEESEPEEVADDEQGLPKGIKKRIDKLVAKRKEIEEQLKAKEEEIESLKSAKPAVADAPIAPLPTNPYLHLDDQTAVESEIQQARRVRRWCEENPDGATVTGPDGKEVDYSSEQIRAIKLNAIDALEEHLPRQLNYVQNKSKLDPIAESEYTWWKNKASREYQAAQNMLKNFPELRRFPDYKIVIGDYIRGSMERENNYSKQKQATSGKAVVKKAPTQPSKPTAAPVQMSKQQISTQAADQKFRKTGSQESLKELILNRFV